MRGMMRGSNMYPSTDFVVILLLIFKCYHPYCSHWDLSYRIHAFNLSKIVGKLPLIPFYHFFVSECEFVAEMWQGDVKHPATDCELRLLVCVFNIILCAELLVF